MKKPTNIELPTGEAIPILYEDRSVIAVDKPAGWMLVPFSWQKTAYNLQAALVSSIKSGAFWATSRQLKFLRFVHRLDAETTGILLLARSAGALATYGEMFESRRMRKLYLAVVEGVPAKNTWVSKSPIGADLERHGRMMVDYKAGKEAETEFQLLQTVRGRTLVEARPHTGRTHQIRLHLRDEELPISGDELYGAGERRTGLGLRAVGLAYLDPFTRREVKIRAPFEEFARKHGFDPALIEARV